MAEGVAASGRLRGAKGCLALLICICSLAYVVKVGADTPVSCSIYSAVQGANPNGATPLTVLRTVTVSSPATYNYSTFGAPPTGQLGQAQTGAEAISLQAAAQKYASLQGGFLSKLASGNFTLNQWDDFKTLLSTAGAPPPYSLPFWEDDSFFGFTRKSVAAQYLVQAQQLPFNLTDSDVSGLLGNQSLDESLRSGKLFVEDLSYPSLIPSSLSRPNRYAPGVVSLFYADDQGNLRPIAIRVAGSALIWTPKDAPFDWLLAKLYANAASFLLEQTNHFFRAHFVPSSMRIAAGNRLFPSHPLRVLVDHYVAGDWGAVAAGLQVVYQAAGGDYSWAYTANGTLAVLASVKGNYNWSTDYLETNVAGRGVANLTNFPYLEDLRAHTAAITNFSNAYVGLYYQNDTDVQSDSELQAWAAELGSTKAVPGFPASIATKNDLAGIITHMIRLVSVEHHLINTYAIYNVYTSPFYNRYMTAPPPTARGTVDNQTILTYVPTKPADLYALFSTAASYRVVLEPRDTILGALDIFHYEPCAAAAVQAYKDALTSIESRIAARESTAKYPFPLAKPSILPYRAFI